MSAADDTKRPRRDAVRNREHVLAAAEQVFARAGVDASMEVIAAEAGVGVGTVYRGFGSKRALVDELFADRVGEAVEVIRAAAGAPSGREALEQVMRGLTDFQSQSRAFRQLMFAGNDHAAALRERVEPLLTGIIERAKSEGAIRADFAATDIALLTRSASEIATTLPGVGADLARRHLELLLKGLTPTPDPAAVPPPLRDDRFGDWMRAVADGTR